MPYIFLVGLTLLPREKKPEKGTRKSLITCYVTNPMTSGKDLSLLGARAEQVLGSILNRGSDYPEPPVYHIQFIPHHITSKSRTARTSC